MDITVNVRNINEWGALQVILHMLNAHRNFKTLRTVLSTFWQLISTFLRCSEIAVDRFIELTRSLIYSLYPNHCSQSPSATKKMINCQLISIQCSSWAFVNCIPREVQKWASLEQVSVQDYTLVHGSHQAHTSSHSTTRSLDL